MRFGISGNEITGQILDGRVLVGRPLDVKRDALFAAEWVGITGPEIVVRIFPASFEPVLERHLEASFLEHPNLLRCFGAGELHINGRRLIYTVLEHFDTTLAHHLASGPLAAGDAIHLARQLCGALAYLHQQDLVYCNLRPSAITCTRGMWQLGDYSQLRAAGPGYQLGDDWYAPTLRSAPPERLEGLVSPAWDSWEMASVLAAALTTSRNELPEPLRTVAAECESLDPATRCSMDRVRLLLDGAAMAAHPSGTASLDSQSSACPRPVRYLMPPQAVAPETGRQEAPPVNDCVSLRDWWDQHGPLTVAAGIVAITLLILLLVYLPGSVENPSFGG